MPKGIVYIDIDDEITGVIDKVESSPEKVLALVLPKHATTFLSSINLKLLKRAGDIAKKSIVLITSDDGIMTLAGTARLHVAKSLQSKPYLPAKPKSTTQEPISLDADSDVEDQFDANVDSKEVSRGVPTAGVAVASVSKETIIQLDNTEKKAVFAKKTLGPKNKKLKVPNFTSFRMRLFLGGFLLVAVAAGLFAAIFILPRAKIVLKTDTTTVQVNTPLTVGTSIKSIDVEKGMLPAIISESKEIDTEKATATGKKDNGTKATGSITIYNCTDNDVVLPAGTVFINSGHSFITDTEASVPASDFFSSGNCKKNRRLAVDVTAVAAGDTSNLSADRDYTSTFASTITGVGSAMGGGTSKIVTVLSSDDIESAKQKLAGRKKTAGVETVKQQLKDAQTEPLPDTLKEKPPVYTADAKVGDEVASAIVKAETSYTMLGIKKEDLTKLIESVVNKQITDTRQKIQNNGYDKKHMQLTDGSKAEDQKLSLTTTAVIGPDIDLAGIAQEAAGKKRGDIQESLSSRAGIKDVTISYSPFWVLQTPKSPSKINVVVEQANGN